MNQIKKAVRKFAKENDLYGRPLTVGTLERIPQKQTVHSLCVWQLQAM